MASIPTEVDYASEFRHRNTPMTPETLVFAISQSGETADTLGALRESRRKGFRTLGICNNVASTIARESDGGVYMHAGPEIGVAATKSFTSQVTILTLLGLLFGRMRNLATAEGTRVIEALQALPEQIEAVLELNDQVKEIAGRYANANGFLFFGRQFNFPDCSRRRAQDEGDHVPFCRRSPERRAQARRDCADPSLICPRSSSRRMIPCFQKT
jgi:glucosamine--fructose-6-phosphate aminotransferase (isomerizing)